MISKYVWQWGFVDAAHLYNSVRLTRGQPSINIMRARAAGRPDAHSPVA